MWITYIHLPDKFNYTHMIHGSLESGIGGFDYAAQQLGWTNAFHCEINPFCQIILKHYWPHATSYTDLFEMDGRPWRGKIDIITAGFPCQPFSHAGKRKGKEDDRFIWTENVRIFREIQPAFIVAENVPGLLTIEHGLVFEQVCADLETEGYEVTPLIIPACAKDACHRRDRVWIVAYSYAAQQRRHQRQSEDERVSKSNPNHPFFGEERHISERDRSRQSKIQTGNSDCTHPHSHLPRLQESEHGGVGVAVHDAERGDTWTVSNSALVGLERGVQTNGVQRPQPNDQLLNGPSGERHESWLEAATRLCRVDDASTRGLHTKTISRGRWRTESLKAYGNAIYWPVAYEIFKSIQSTLTICNPSNNASNPFHTPL